jgi:hypothetical protein
VTNAYVGVFEAAQRFPSATGGSSSETGHPVSRLSRSEGLHRFPILRPGALVWIEVTRAKGADGARYGHTLAGPFELRPGTREVVLVAMQRIEGRVLGADGKPLQGVWILATRSRSPLRHARGGVHAQTDGDGCFILEGLSAGVHALFLRQLKGHLREKAIEVPAGTADLVIRLRLGIECEVRVLTADGKPVGGARVKATRSGSWLTAETNWEGIAKLTDLDPDLTYDLEVNDLCSEKKHPLLRVEEWKPENTVLHFEASVMVSGTVVNAAGEPVNQADVLWNDETGWKASTRASSHGSFELRVRAGTSGQLRALPPDGVWFAPRGEGIPAVAGDTAVVLRCVRTTTLEVRVTNWPVGASGRALLRLPGDVRGAHPRYDRPGIFSFALLTPGQTGRLEIVCPGEGLALVKERVSTDAGRIEVKLAEALTIEGSLKLPKGATPHSVVATKDGLNVAGNLALDGAFTLGGLVPGTWTVIGRAYRGNQSLSGQAKVAAGGRVVITVTTVEEE